MTLALPNAFGRRLMVALISAGTFWASCGHAADAYLDQLEAEASDLTFDSAVPLEGSNLPVEPEDSGVPPDLDMPGFEDLLRSRYIGSFMFYNKLSDGDKTTVYDEYLSSKDIELIRKKIISLFSAN